MQIIKAGRHRLFETDPDTAKYVSELLAELRRGGLAAVRELSRKFDGWAPEDFELSADQIRAAIAQCPAQLIADTAYCQDNVRRFATAQLQMFQPLEVESRPGVWLGHRHLPVRSVGSYVPGGRYPMFGSAQMSIIPAKVAGVKTVVACTPPMKGGGAFPATIHAMHRAGPTGSSCSAACRRWR